MARSRGFGPARMPPRIGIDDDPRQDALGRLIVRLLEDVIADDDDAGAPAAVPRNAARAVVAVIRDTLGEPAVAEYQSLCRKVLVRVSRGRSVAGWNAFYVDETARELQESVLVNLAFHLERLAPDARAFAGLLNAAMGERKNREKGH